MGSATTVGDIETSTFCGAPGAWWEALEKRTTSSIGFSLRTVLSVCMGHLVLLAVIKPPQTGTSPPGFSQLASLPDSSDIVPDHYGSRSRRDLI